MVWYSRNYNSGGNPSVTPFAYGGGDPSWTRVTGNWDGVGGDTIGAVHRESAGVFRDLVEKSEDDPGDPRWLGFVAAAEDVLGGDAELREEGATGDG